MRFDRLSHPDVILRWNNRGQVAVGRLVPQDSVVALWEQVELNNSVAKAFCIGFVIMSSMDNHRFVSDRIVFVGFRKPFLDAIGVRRNKPRESEISNRNMPFDSLVLRALMVQRKSFLNAFVDLPMPIVLFGSSREGWIPCTNMESKDAIIGPWASQIRDFVLCQCVGLDKEIKEGLIYIFFISQIIVKREIDAHFVESLSEDWQTVERVEHLAVGLVVLVSGVLKVLDGHFFQLWPTLTSICELNDVVWS